MFLPLLNTLKAQKESIRRRIDNPPAESSLSFSIGQDSTMQRAMVYTEARTGDEVHTHTHLEMWVVTGLGMWICSWSEDCRTSTYMFGSTLGSVGQGGVFAEGQ